jgi:hypothetical protein
MRIRSTDKSGIFYFGSFRQRSIGKLSDRLVSPDAEAVCTGVLDATVLRDHVRDGTLG